MRKYFKALKGYAKVQKKKKLLNFLAIMYVLGKYETIAFKHWRLLYTKRTKNKQQLAKVLRKLRRTRIGHAFHTIKDLFGNISRTELIRMREENWLTAVEREQVEREAKVKDVTHLLLSEGAFHKSFSYEEIRGRSKVSQTSQPQFV